MRDPRLMKRSAAARRPLALVAALSIAAGPAGAAPPPASQLPASPSAAASPLAAHAMVAAADPRAVEAGLKVLRAGGSAIDAAVAVQAVLGLVEPQSSGLGGGAFMVWYDAEDAQGHDLRRPRDGAGRGDAAAVLRRGRQAAVLHRRDPVRPLDRGAGGDRDAGAGAQGPRPAALGVAVRRRRAAGAGRLRGRRPDGAGGERALAAGAHARREPPISPRPTARACRRATSMRNPAYADALALIARKGAAGLLQGRSRRDLVARTHAGPRPGALTVADLAAYRPLRRAALCAPYRGYRVCGAPPPGGDGGGAGDPRASGPDGHRGSRPRPIPPAWVTFAQASRLGYADRDRYVGDPAFVSVPTAGLLDPAYLDGRAKAVATLGGAAVQPGTPAGAGDARARPHARAGRHLGPRHRGRAGKRAVDDHDGGERVRVGPDDARLLPEQPADRLLLHAARRPTARPRPTRWRPASGRARRWRR